MEEKYRTTDDTGELEHLRKKMRKLEAHLEFLNKKYVSRKWWMFNFNLVGEDPEFWLGFLITIGIVLTIALGVVHPLMLYHQFHFGLVTAFWISIFSTIISGIVFVGWPIASFFNYKNEE